MRYPTKVRYKLSINAKGQRNLATPTVGSQRFYLRPRRLTSTLASSENDDHYFSYTSGRWLYDEEVQLRRRYIKLNVGALRNAAASTLGSRCVDMSKLPEGLYNKVFSLVMEDGSEILARIPNPNAGDPDYVVESEVATIEFVRSITVLVLGWLTY